MAAGEMWAAAFVTDSTGSVVAEHRKIHPPLPCGKMLLNESLHSSLQLTHVCVFSHVLLWLLEFYRPEKYMREHKSATARGDVICPDLYRLFFSFSCYDSTMYDQRS